MLVCQNIFTSKILLLFYLVKFKYINMQMMAIIPHLTNFIKIYSHFLKDLSGNALIIINSKLFVLLILSWQILPYQQLNISINFVLSLIQYNKAWILLIITLYIFVKALSKFALVILHLLPAFSVFYLTVPALSIIWKLLLTIIKQYISLSHRIIELKSRKTTFIL